MSNAYDAAREEINDLGVEAVAPGMTAIALALAKALDSAADAPASAPAIARELRATLLELRKLSPPAVKGDALDELTARRAERRGA
ncbi:hypothetical protein ACFWCB_26315 [Streptomyces sp. NPDC060048]|uniref:hypothetical protein n=1 Tax=unclassified Streptomyces TaxID=2593676 RepID=UPI0036945DE5